ncbi:hypothetical protein [Paraburkholderia franconis]|nr:hypothetical protein [Paraburkholderia franconis]
MAPAAGHRTDFPRLFGSEIAGADHEVHVNPDVKISSIIGIGT